MDTGSGPGDGPPVDGSAHHRPSSGDDEPSHDDPSSGDDPPFDDPSSGARPGRRRASTRRVAAAEPPGTGSAAADREPDPESVARTIALRLLTGAPHSRAQLAEAMARKDVPDDVADRVLDRFTEVGLVDDAEYARILVRSRHADRGLARRALGVELRRKGIDDELAAQALSTVDTEQEETTARRMAGRRLAATRGLPTDVRVRRVTGMLGRKGYPGGLAHRVVRELLAEETADGVHGDDETSWDGSLDDDVASVPADDG